MQYLPVKIESSLLSKNDLNSINELSSELSDAYAKRQIFRTETEARMSVLNDLAYSTLAAKYWQCVREQVVMLEQLAQMSFDFRKNEIEILKINRALDIQACVLNPEKTKLDVMYNEVVLDELMYKRQQLLSVAADRMREIRMWSMLKEELNDGSFDTQDCNSHQLVSYATKLALTLEQTDRNSFTAPELINVIGQLSTSIRILKEQKMIE